MGPDISIVIPAFNEAHRLPATLERLVAELPEACPGSWEVIVSDDGSTDETASIAGGFGSSSPVRVISASPNHGKGAALLRGIRAAKHDRVLLLDADLPVPVSTIPSFLALSGEADLVLGSRRVPGASSSPKQPLPRRAGGRAFRAVVRILGYRVTTDPQCGVKLLDTSRMGLVLDSMRCEGFAFDVELIERSRRAELTSIEVPVQWSHVEGSSLHPLRDAVLTLRDLVALRSGLRESQLAVAGSLR